MIRQSETYIFCAKCRTELQKKHYYKVCPNCGKHYYFNSRPTVTVILRDSKSRILLTKRLHEPFKDWWDLPGGFVEEDESLEQAAEREIKEETNLVVSDLKYLGSVPEDYLFREEIIPVVAAIFLGSVNDTSKLKVNDDVSDYKFVSEQDIDPEKIAFDNQREFLKNLLDKQLGTTYIRS